MSVQLLPRLTALGVNSVLEHGGAGELRPTMHRDFLAERSAMLSYAASGGHRSEEAAIELGKRIREVAGNAGFPDNPSQVARTKFDHDVSILLTSAEELQSGEALRDDVWSFLATAVIPDIVAWRFPDRAHHRFEGGVRNAIQRLWVRGVALDRGPTHEERWGLVRGLTEDAAVQIFERPSIAANRLLAIALGEGWLRMSKKIGRPAMEPVMRRAVKLFRLRNEIFDIGGLEDADRDAVVTWCFDQALASEHRTSE